jgi:hypothetical protein
MNRVLPFALAILLVLPACDSANPSETDSQIVVEAFLFAGEPVDDIRLAEALPLASEDTTATPIRTADVWLTKDGVVYSLVPSDSAGYYHYPGDDLAIEAGDVIRLEADDAGRRVTAETTVPPPPADVTLPQNTLEVATFDGGGLGGGPPGRIEENTLTVTWGNPNEALHYVVVESLVGEDPEYILPEFVRDRFGGFRLITAPTTANFHDIHVRSLEVLGEHQVLVYRVNQEYADLYENREQDSRDLNEPPTNVEDGLGVFSAFSSRAVTFQVVRAD